MNLIPVLCGAFLDCVDAKDFVSALKCSTKSSVGRTFCDSEMYILFYMSRDNK